MSYRNPEQAYFNERTVYEAPLNHQEELLVTEFSNQRRTDRNITRLSVRDLIAQASPDSDKYSRSEIEQDERTTAEHRIRSGTGEQTERAQLLEDVVRTGGAQFGWFGNPEITQLIGTTEYDDRHNFVDAVVAYRRKDGTSSYLAIDLVAARANSGSLSKKRAGLERFISQGHLYESKYLIDRMAGNRPVIKRVANMPWVNIGMDPATITELSEHLYAYYRPEAALKELRDKLGLKAYNKEHPQTPQAMKESARQKLASDPKAYDIAQEAYAQLGSQALLAFNVFLDRANMVLHEERLELMPFVEKIADLELAVAEFRAHLNADPAEVGREETVAALIIAYQQLAEYEALEKATGYPVREMIKSLLPFVKHFGKLATQRQALADPEKEDPTVKILARPWESDQLTRRQLAAA